MNRNEILSLVQANTGREDKDSLILSFFSFARQRLIQAHNWRCLQEQYQVTVGEDEYSFPVPAGTAALLRVGLLNDVSTQILPVIPRRKFDQLFVGILDGAVNSGTPTVASEVAGTVFFGPPANAEFTFVLTRVKELSVLSSGTSSWDTELPGADEFLLYFACSRLWFSLGNITQGREFERLWKETLGQLIESDMDNPVVDQNMDFSDHTSAASLAPWYDPFVKSYP